MMSFLPKIIFTTNRIELEAFDCRCSCAGVFIRDQNIIYTWYPYKMRWFAYYVLTHEVGHWIILQLFRHRRRMPDYQTLWDMLWIKIRDIFF